MFDQSQMTLREVADYLDFPLSTIRRWARMGRIVGTEDVDGRWLFNREDVDAFIEQSRIRPRVGS